MRMRLTLAALMVLAVLAGKAGAQANVPVQSEAEIARDNILAILGIPRRADEIRAAGGTDESVRSVLDILRQRRVPPRETEEILVAHRDAVREHGPTDNFGAFVQAQLDQGLRGRDLAAAIRAEHQARGKGKGMGGNAEMRGRPDDAASKGGRPDDAGAKGKRPDDAGAAKGGRPDDAGAKGGKRPDSGAARGNSKRPNL